MTVCNSSFSIIQTPQLWRQPMDLRGITVTDPISVLKAHAENRIALWGYWKVGDAC